MRNVILQERNDKVQIDTSNNQWLIGVVFVANSQIRWNVSARTRPYISKADACVSRCTCRHERTRKYAL